MQNLIKAKACLLAGILVLTSLFGGCNKDIGSDKENTVSTTVTTETTAETTLSATTAESEITTTASSEQEQSSTTTATEQPTSVIAATTTLKTTATTKTTVPTTTSTKVTTTTAAPTTTTPKATQPPVTNPPQTQPPATQPPVITTKATEPTVNFDPQIYLDYAIEYGTSIGLEYDATLGVWEGEDNPIKYANWNNPKNITPELDVETMKRGIREHCGNLLEHDKAKYFRVEVYKSDDLNWITPYENNYLLFIFWARN